MESVSTTSSSAIPPSIDRVLKLFRSMGREEKMQALVQYSKKLEPLPERFKDIDRGAFTVPECQTRVDIIPELRPGQAEGQRQGDEALLCAVVKVALKTPALRVAGGDDPRPRGTHLVEL